MQLLIGSTCAAVVFVMLCLLHMVLSAATMEETLIPVAVTFYRTNQEGTAEKCSFSRSRVPIPQEAKDSLTKFKSVLVDFLGIKDKITELGFGNYDLKLFRLVNDGQRKPQNFEIFTNQQYNIEMKTFLENIKTNELNGEYKLYDPPIDHPAHFMPPPQGGFGIYNPFCRKESGILPHSCSPRWC